MENSCGIPVFVKATLEMEEFAQQLRRQVCTSKAHSKNGRSATKTNTELFTDCEDATRDTRHDFDLGCHMRTHVNTHLTPYNTTAY